MKKVRRMYCEMKEEKTSELASWNREIEGEKVYWLTFEANPPK